MARIKSVYEKFGTSTLVGSVPAARRCTVVGGDTLPSIAASQYPGEGYSSEAWRQIAEYNNIDDLDALTIGTVLTIPNLQPVD